MKPLNMTVLAQNLHLRQRLSLLTAALGDGFDVNGTCLLGCHTLHPHPLHAHTTACPFTLAEDAIEDTDASCATALDEWESRRERIDETSALLAAVRQACIAMFDSDCPVCLQVYVRCENAINAYYGQRSDFPAS